MAMIDDNGFGGLQLDSTQQKFLNWTQSGKAKEDEIARYRVMANAHFFNAQLAGGPITATGWNFDSAPADSKGLALAKDLEQAMQEVLREQKPDMNAFNLFAMDTRVNENAQFYSQRRIEHFGSADFYDGAHSHIPSVSLGQEEEKHSVRILVSGYQMTMFEQGAMSFAGIDLASELQDACTYVMYEKINDLSWTGDVNRNLPGIAYQPYVPEATFGLTMADSTAGELIAQELCRLARINPSLTKNTFRPKRIITSHRLASYLQERELSDFKEKTIADRVIGRSAYIEEIIGVHELEGKGPNGSDLMIFDAGMDRRKGYSIVMPKRPTFLPIQTQGLKTIVPCYCKFGGVRTLEPRNSLRVNVSVATGAGNPA